MTLFLMTLVLLVGLPGMFLVGGRMITAAAERRRHHAEH
jgi:hypothetical protein